MVKATKPGIDIFQSCSDFSSHCVKVNDLESVISIWASLIALKNTHAQLLVWCIYATAVFGNEGPASALNKNLVEKNVFGYLLL